MLPAAVRLLPFHAASQLANVRLDARAGTAGGGASQASSPRSWRILELLDRPDDEPLFGEVEKSLAVTAWSAEARADFLLRVATSSLGNRPSSAESAPRYNLIYIHPGCDSRSEFRALVAALDPHLAPDGLLWLQLIDPVFAPRELPPTGRTLPALSAFLAALPSSRWRWAFRSQRANFAPELLIGRVALDSENWAALAERFARGFSDRDLPADAWCGVPGPAAAVRPAAVTASASGPGGNGGNADGKDGAGGVGGADASGAPRSGPPGTQPARSTPVGEIHQRDGLGTPTRGPDGRWFRPVTLTAGCKEPAAQRERRAVFTLVLPAAPAQANEPAGNKAMAWRCCRVRVGCNPEAQSVRVAWLATPAFRRPDMESAPQALPAGTHDQIWMVAAPAASDSDGLLHLLVSGMDFRCLHEIQVDCLAEHAAAAPQAPAAANGLGRDMLARHRLVAARLEASGARQVLDIGGAPGLLAALLPERQLTIVDTAHAAEHPGFLRLAAVGAGEPLALPFADGAFDAVAALDVLEHIPAAARPNFVREAARVSNGAVYLAGPVASAAAVEAEATLAAALPAAHEFLEEHRRFGLPTKEEIAAWIEAAGRAVVAVEEGSSVHQWLTDTAADLGLSLAPSTLTAATADVPYRRLFVAQGRSKGE
ncbi:MAG: class I SAM-dependent methyltransferase [Planctomycetota bacterium]